MDVWHSDNAHLSKKFIWIGVKRRSTLLHRRKNQITPETLHIFFNFCS
jgi:hypothetical protein